MKIINIFIGSSFRLMRERRRICDIVRQLNDQWLSSGIRIKLYIWEDFVIGFSGKNKQQEYIDEMVLPSDISIFVFSHQVGIYTKMELVAKLKQDKKAVFCFRMPHKGKFAQNVKNDLDALVCTFSDVTNGVELGNQIKDIITEYINSINTSTEKSNDTNALYFYTTIPGDLTRVQSDIGTTFIDLDDATMDEWGIHCQLHPRKCLPLFDETDHYIPILKQDVSEDDFRELEVGIEKASDKTHRLKRMTVFDMGDISKDNAKVHDLLDSHGIFTDKIKELDALKWKIHKWIRQERQKLFSNATEVIDVSNGKVTINEKAIGLLSTVDNTGNLSLIVSDIEQNKIKIVKAIETHENDQVIQSLLNEQKQRKGTLSLMLENGLNNWTSQLDFDNEKDKESFDKCLRIEKEVKSIISKPIENEASLKQILIKWESMERQLVESQCLPPIRLLSTQLFILGIFDTYLNNGIAQSNEEDALYGRILTDADSSKIQDPIIEMIRMNRANMYARLEEHNEARDLYTQAIENLQAMYDGSVMIAQNITYILTLLYHLELRYGTKEDIAGVLAQFKNHIGHLDVSHKSFFVDQCMYITSELIAIDIEDNTNFEIVETAESYFNEANKKLLLSTDNNLYDDIFIYLPNMIARYYIDHLAQMVKETKGEYWTKAESLLKNAIDNCVKMQEVKYGISLFHQGELLDQLGFLYAKHSSTFELAIDAYKNSIDIKRRFFALSGDKSYEIYIAHVLVNYASLELSILENRQQKRFERTEFLNLKQYVLEALDIYSRHLSRKEAELGYYETLQLKGTIYYYFFNQDPQAIILYNEAISALFQCWRWNKKHPNNPYRMSFIAYSGRILKERNFITEDEFENVKNTCEGVN